jgi:hypothetical protein
MFLKELELWLKRGQNVPFLREMPPKKIDPFSVPVNGAIA